MTKVLFICHGNICRSPMAEFMFKNLIKNRGLSTEYQIASAATSTEEIGNPVYPPAKRKLAEYGLSCQGKTARQVKRSEYDQWDYFICMDQYNVRNLTRIFGSDPQHKISKMLEWAGSDADVADPWYTGEFQTTYDDISKGLEGLLNKLMKEKR